MKRGCPRVRRAARALAVALAMGARTAPVHGQHLHVPRGAAVDSVLRITVDGLRAGQEVVLPAGSTRIAGGRLETGGTPQANAAAQAGAWPRVLRFLDLALQR